VLSRNLHVDVLDKLEKILKIVANVAGVRLILSEEVLALEDLVEVRKCTSKLTLQLALPGSFKHLVDALVAAKK
jgi:hypothetical protein